MPKYSELKKYHNSQKELNPTEESKIYYDDSPNTSYDSLKANHTKRSEYSPIFSDDKTYKAVNDSRKYSDKSSSGLGNNSVLQNLLDNLMKVKISNQERDAAKSRAGMTDDQVGAYNYIYATKGKDKAQEYLDSIQSDVNKQSMESDIERAKKFAKEHPVISSVETVAAKPYEAVSAVNQFADKIVNGRVDENADYNKFSRLNTETRSSVQEDMNGVEQFLYGTGMSMADFLYTTAINGGASAGKVGQVLSVLNMGSGAGAATTIEAKQRGLSDNQAMLLGTISAGAEALTEFVSIDKLFDKRTLVDNLGKYILQNTIAEGSEEGASDVINFIADQLIAGDKSQFNMSVQNYVSQGLSEEDAYKSAFVDEVKQLGLDVLGGALSGGVMSGGAAGISAATNYVTDTKTGKEIKADQNKVNETIEDAKNTPENSKAYQQFQKIQNSENVSDRDIGKLSRFNDMAEQDKVWRMQTMENATDEYSRKGKLSTDTLKSIANSPALINDIAEQTGVEINPDAKYKELKSKINEAVKIAAESKPMYTSEEDLAEKVENQSKIEEQVAESNPLMKSIIEKKQEAQKSDVGQVTKVENGKAFTVNDKGEEVEITTENATKPKDVISAEIAKVVDTPTYVNLVSNAYDGNIKHETYVSLMSDAIEMSRTKGIDLSRSSSPVFNALNKYQKQIAYTIGQQTRNESQFKTETKKLNTKGKGFVGDYESLTEDQKKEVDFLEKVVKLAGNETSFTIEEAKEGSQENGYIDGDGTIHLFTNSSLIWTFGHESLHQIKKSNEGKFNEIADVLVKTMYGHGVDVDNLVKQKMATYRQGIAEINISQGMSQSEALQNAMDTVTYDYAYEEFVADALQTVLTDTNAVEYMEQIQKENQTVFDWIKDFVNKLLNAVKEIYDAKDVSYQEAKIFQNFNNNEREKLGKLFAEAMVEISQDTEVENIINGVEITEDNQIKAQLKQWNESGRQITLDAMISKFGEVDANIMMSEIDGIADVMTEVMNEHPEFKLFSQWQEAEWKNEDGKPIMSVTVKNGDYKLNVDFSRVCKKRRQLDAVLNLLASDPEFEARYLNKESFVKINEAIKDRGFEIACALCFVDAKRFRQAEWADSFANTWNSILESVVDDKSKLTPFNFATNNPNVKDEGIEIDPLRPVSYDKYEDGEIKETRSYGSLYEMLEKKNKDTYKENNANVRTIVTLLMEHPEYRHTFRGADIVSSNGFDTAHRLAPEIRAILDGWGGSSVPKPSSLDASYDSSILTLSMYNPEVAFAMGGARMNSFSDFMAHMFFDYCEAFVDLATKGLPAQSYTKELDFARLFGRLGIKINMSGIAAIRGNSYEIEYDKKGNAKKSAANMKKYNAEKRISGLDPTRLCEYLGKDVIELTDEDVSNNLDLLDYIWADESIDMTKATLLQTGILFDKLSDTKQAECYELIKSGKISEAHKAAGKDNVDTEYCKHIGTIVVGVSDAHIRKLLRDNTIRMVIPYHKSGLNGIVAKTLKIAVYSDYTNVQNTKVTPRGKKASVAIDKAKLVDFDFYEYFGKTVNGVLYDGKATADKYLDWCKNGYLDEETGERYYLVKVKEDENNSKSKTITVRMSADEFHQNFTVNPKFENFADEENYYKLLEDFDCYNTITNEHSPQEAVQFIQDGLPADYKDVLTEALKLEQENVDKFSDEFNNKGLRDEIMSIVKSNGYSPKEKVDISPKSWTESKVAPLEKKFQLKDSEGNTLTKEQAEYFKNSKVRDKNGNLKSVYHGTQYGGFTVFDENFADDGFSHWFTDSYDVSATYSGTIIDDFAPNKSQDFSSREKNDFVAPENSANYLVYLNIENPLVINANGSNWNSIINYQDGHEYLSIEELNDEQIEYFANWAGVEDYDELEEYVWSSTGGKNYKEMKLFDVTDYEFNIPMSTREWVRDTYDSGYDGVIFENVVDEGAYSYEYGLNGDTANVYVAFDSNQIKSINNTNPTSDPDIRYQLKDSEGNTLTQEQSDYFKDSKIRDEDGNLRVVYHGTDTDFTVFDASKGRANMDIQGMFFSPYELDAQGYGKSIGSYYLNITNPASESVGYKALNMYKGQNNAGVKAREYLISQGYDGVDNGGDEYIAFYPEQIKGVDNSNPTENPDVRYQLKDSNGNSLSQEQVEYFKDSKVRDEYGRLKVAYHGTNEFGFTVFDASNSDDDLSLFFSDNKTVANTYVNDENKIYQTYLNIKKPYIIDAKYNSWKKLIMDSDLEGKPEFIKDIYAYLNLARRYDEQIELFTLMDSIADIVYSTEHIFDEEANQDDDLGSIWTEDEKAEMIRLANNIESAYMSWDEDEHIDEDGDTIPFQSFVNDSRITYRNTRYVSRYAYENGYDGVIIKNVNDNGKFYSKIGVRAASNVYIVFDSNQVKSIDNKNPTDSDDIRYQLKSNYGYHAGDLGKSRVDQLSGQGKSRGTGHFGFGTYFVGDKSKLDNAFIGDERPIETVDFDKYNLWKPRNSEEGFKVHEALKEIDGGINPQFLDKLLSDYIPPFDYIRYVDMYDLGEQMFGEDRYNTDNRIATIQEFAKQNGIDLISLEEYINQEGISQEDAKDYYKEYAENRVEEEAEKINAEYHKLLRAYETLRLIFRDADKALRQVVEYQNSMPEDKWDTDGADSYATVFMKSLGYEGVDVRHTNLDNTTFGSVIYDLKDEDLERKKEIGTAKYQLRDKNIEKLNKSLQRQNNRLIADNENLKELLKLQKEVTHGANFKKANVDKAAQSIMKKFGAKGSVGEFSQVLDGVYNYISTTDNLSIQSMRKQSADAIDWIKTHTDTYDWFDYGQFLNEDVFTEIYNGYWDAAILTTVSDKYSKKIADLKKNQYESTERLKEASSDRYSKKIADLKKKHKENSEKLKEISREKTETINSLKKEVSRVRREERAKSKEKQNEIAKTYQAARKAGVESRNRTVLRNKVIKKWSKLNKLLINETETQHVPLEFKQIVASALSEFNMSTTDYDTRVENILEEMSKAKTPEKLEELQAKYDRAVASQENQKQRLNALSDAYEQIKRDGRFADSFYAEEVLDQIAATKEAVGNTPISSMSTEQLESLNDLYSMILHTISEANKFKAIQKQIGYRDAAENISSEIGDRKHKDLPERIRWIRKFGWNNLKPIYAIEAIGSKTLNEIFGGISNAEGVYAQDIDEAKIFYEDMFKKYNVKSWDMDKTFKFKSRDGKEFELNTNQMMSIYAYSRRKQAEDHLLGSGFRFNNTTQRKGKAGIEYEFTDTETYALTLDTLIRIGQTLTNEQRAYAEEMQEYLSSTMGEKGNSISRALYGIEKFKEKYYFPLKSDRNFLEIKNQPVAESSLKNSGFSKSVVKYANNPVVLEEFQEVWANHVNDMSTYHAFVLPIEDFNKTYGYHRNANDEREAFSLKSDIERAYSKDAINYIDQMLKDVNGGVKMPSASGFETLINRFKKGAVFASASVTIQQPSAIARAFSMIDLKYFPSSIGSAVFTTNHDKQWSELKKYAPVAIIKEMGYFDTNMGQTAVDWITTQNPEGIQEKAKALLDMKDSSYRDEILSKAPALADEITWVSIWEAVKKEQYDNGYRGEELLTKSGERFTDVIQHTQVYDSVLSRSGMMRSQNMLDKMATAFMAEPTTSANMLLSAAIDAKSGDSKTSARKVGAVYASFVLNAALVAIVKGARDRDDDQTYLEKYLEAIVGELNPLTSSINPLTLLPYVRDIISLAQGYSVERTDMSVIKDVVDSLSDMNDYRLTFGERINSLAGAIGNLFGVPYRNVARDINGIVNVVNGAMSDNETSTEGLVSSVKSGLDIDKFEQQVEYAQKTKLADALRSGDSSRIKDAVSSMKQNGYEDKDIKSIVGNIYRESYKNGNVSEKIKIRDILYDTGVYGKTYVDVQKWLEKNWDKKSK